MTMLNEAKSSSTATHSPSPAASVKPRYKGKTGARILHEMLVDNHKVDTMFGYPGGAILPVFDELYKTPAKFILNRHEQGSGHCADGYARATGRPGVCIVTSGPGATNTVTPLATAQMDSVPIIVFSGQVPTKVIGNDAFQEADVTMHTPGFPVARAYPSAQCPLPCSCRFRMNLAGVLYNSSNTGRIAPPGYPNIVSTL